ncbi:MAG: phospholipase D family protein [Terrimicrobiaceae bacterium]
MLDCKRNRLDYGELLCPPEGYLLDRAVATTYSADLETLLSLPVALVYAQTLEGDFTGTRFQLLEAIKQFAGKAVIYHQKGRLLVPSKLNWLHAYLEDALVPILPEDAFTAFHPKTWIIRYRRKEDEAADKQPEWFRVLVLSRNLTFDRSWDVAACLEGAPGGRPVRLNKPLVDWVQWLHGLRPIPEVEEFVDGLSRVPFTAPPPFEWHGFHPIGIPGYQTNPVADRDAAKVLAISPFLHEAAVRGLREHARNQCYLFSDRSELETLPPEAFDGVKAYQLMDLVVDGELSESAEDGGGDAKQQNLHAKMFIFENKAESTWFMGSANATQAALNRNVEFMLELGGSSAAIRVHRRLPELTGEKEGAGPFVEFVPGQTHEDAANVNQEAAEFRKFEHALLGADVQARVQTSGNGTNFDLHINLNLEKVQRRPGIVLMLQPFQSQRKLKPIRLKPGQRETCVFENIPEVELSRFLHFRIEDSDGDALHEFLWLIEIEGLPAERLDNILRKIIDSREKFFDYLRFLLAGDVTKEDLLAGMQEKKSGAGGEGEETTGWTLDLPIYEQLLITASRSPQKLQEVNEVIKRLSAKVEGTDCVIPDTFLSFWESFRVLIPSESKGAK